MVRVRLPGGGRKKLSVSDPQLLAELKALVAVNTSGPLPFCAKVPVPMMLLATAAASLPLVR